MKTEQKTRCGLVLLAVMTASLALTACNTVSGVGKDLQEASDNVKQAIED